MNKQILSAKRLITASAFQTGNLLGLNTEYTSILCYHSISHANWAYAVRSDQFTKQLDKIRQEDRFLTPTDILESAKGIKPVASGVLITIDDGYADVMSIFPYTQKYGIKPVLFVLSHPERANRSELQHRGRLLNWKEIKSLITAGWTIGSHSATHADFSRLSDRELAFEINESKKAFEKKLGIRVKYFAYPKGVTNPRIQELVKKAGYTAAFGINSGCVTEASSIWDLPRTVVQSTHRAQEFPAIYSPSTYLVRKIADQIVGKIL